MALALVPPLLMVVVLAAKFQGLPSAAAADHAQLARHVAAGEGFVTDFLRPLSLVFRANYRNHPDLYNAPAHPFVLALFYRALHPSDKVTAGAGAALWILSVWLTFGVARRWLDPGVAALATLFYGCNVAAILAAVEGLPQPLLAISVLLAVWLAFPEEEELAGDLSASLRAGLPAWRLVLVGLACALATLTHYLLGTVAFALGVYLVASQQAWDVGRGTWDEGPEYPVTRHLSPATRRKGRALAWFMAGFLLLLLPWTVRNFRVAGSPVFSLFWYEALAHTPAYPGESVWRTAMLPLSPVAFLLQHPLQVARKFLLGLDQFWTTALNGVNPVIGLLFLAALFSEAESARVRWLRAVVAGSLLLGVVGSCLLRPEPALLLAWEPLLAIFGAAYLSEWISERVGNVSFWGLTIPGYWTRAAAYLTVVGAIIFPFFLFMAVSRPGPAPRIREQMEPLRSLLPTEAMVMTDQPAFVAWYANRRAVWLCQREEDWTRLERHLGPVDAAYLTPGIAQMSPAEWSGWWSYLAAPQGTYWGLAPAEPGPPLGVLRVRRSDE